MAIAKGVFKGPKVHARQEPKSLAKGPCYLIVYRGYEVYRGYMSHGQLLFKGLCIRAMCDSVVGFMRLYVRSVDHGRSHWQTTQNLPAPDMAKAQARPTQEIQSCEPIDTPKFL